VTFMHFCGCSSGTLFLALITIETKIIAMKKDAREKTRARSGSKKIPLPNYFSEVLKETLEESAVTQKDIAEAVGIPAAHLSEMKHGKRRITPENDLRLSRYFRITSGYFLRLQLRYELELSEELYGKTVRKEVIPMA
jgi:addiction module HigA family antidote